MVVTAMDKVKRLSEERLKETKKLQRKRDTGTRRG